MFARLRKTRKNPILRDMIRENSLSVNDFVYPLFIVDKNNAKNEIKSMPNIYQLGFEEFLQEIDECLKLGIKSFLLFGVLDENKKDEIGSDALNDNGLMARAIKLAKNRFGDKVFLIADLCFCEYTNHGHCGIVENCDVDNDKTIEISQKQALVLARAGIDMIAPSGMMDGIIFSLRKTLDENGFTNLPLMAYSTKFASAYYGPFRNAANSSPKMGDRKTYQMDVANGREALLESLEDENQGADILMVKPALAYLDIVKELSQNTLKPIAVYNVSGEYSMLNASKDLIDYDRLVFENMLAFKRAGAKIIISYHAKEVARMIKNDK